MIETLVTAIGTAVITGGLSAWGTVAALRVHIDYLRSSIERHDVEIRCLREKIGSGGHV